MHKLVAISLALVLAMSACVDRPTTPPAVQPAPTPIDLTAASEDELEQHIGRPVTVRGRFSIHGKIGPGIILSGRQIYLKPKDPFSGVHRDSKLEGRDVRVTGTLRFFKSPKASPGPVIEARPTDHYYFDEDEAKVEFVDGVGNN